MPEPRCISPRPVLPDRFDRRQLQLIRDRRRTTFGRIAGRRIAESIEGQRYLASRSRSPRGLGSHGADEVDRLRQPDKSAATQLLEVFAIARDEVPALRRVGHVRGGTAVDLVEGALAEDARNLHPGCVPESLEEIEIGVAATRHREAVVESADLFEQRSGDEQAVALDDAVEPIALSDEVRYLEEAVAIDGPVDPVEEAILHDLVVTGVERISLLTGADIPLLRRDDCRCVCRNRRHPESQHPGREHVCAVDHECDNVPARHRGGAVAARPSVTDWHPRRGRATEIRARSSSRTLRRDAGPEPNRCRSR